MQRIYWSIVLFVAILAGSFVIESKQDFVSSLPEPIPWQKPEKTSTDILFVGDIMLDRAVRTIIRENGIDFLFNNATSTFKTVDKVVGNLEGVFSLNKSIAGSNYPLRFTFNPLLAIDLSRLGIDIVSQANNHALDFGWDGLAQSTSTLQEAGINFFGDPTNNNPTPYTFVSNHNQITLIGYHEFSYKNTDKVIEEIKKAKTEGSFVIVVPHWGVEYQFMPSTFQKTMAHTFVDAGADAVIGGHPHVIEPVEVYKGKVIFYSLGNFIFDQWFEPDVMQALSVKMKLNKNQVRYTIIPLYIDHARPGVAESSLRDSILMKVADGSVVDDEMRADLINGEFVLSR
jgi:poly-gamma-glutamate synthesis protein (capsule biosynthesis protein)